jgi:cysteine desulfurase
VRTYLDHNATSPLRDSVKAAMRVAMDVVGNASSVHREGRLARKVLDDSREAIAHAIGVLAQQHGHPQCTGRAHSGVCH